MSSELLQAIQYLCTVFQKKSVERIRRTFGHHVKVTSDSLNDENHL